MTAVYSTLDIHPRERLSYWLDVATKAFVRHEFHSSTGPSFAGTLRRGFEFTAGPLVIILGWIATAVMGAAAVRMLIPG